MIIGGTFSGSLTFNFFKTKFHFKFNNTYKNKLNYYFNRKLQTLYYKHFTSHFINKKQTHILLISYKHKNYISFGKFGKCPYLSQICSIKSSFNCRWPAVSRTSARRPNVVRIFVVRLTTKLGSSSSPC